MQNSIELYSSTKDRPKIPTTLEGLVQDVLVEEVYHAVKQMKNSKAPGEDGVVIDIIKEGGFQLYKHIVRLFTSCLVSRKIPQSWNNAVIILLHKKGNVTDINNTDQ